MKFKNIITVSENLQMEILEWRNHIDIRKFMYTDTVISVKSHKQWLSHLKNTQEMQVFIAYKENKEIGIVSLSNINDRHLSADWAFYLNPKYLNLKSYGVLMEYNFLNFVFSETNIEKLNCEVLATNPSVIKLHKKFLFQEEGIRRKNIIKNNERIDVFLLGILKEEWLQARNKFDKVIKRLKNENR